MNLYQKANLVFQRVSSEIPWMWKEQTISRHGSSPTESIQSSLLYSSYWLEVIEGSSQRTAPRESLGARAPSESRCY